MNYSSERKALYLFMKTTLTEINSYAANNPAELVARAEKHYNDEIRGIAERIAANDDIKIVALSGPSASGKTTTAHILSDRLKELGEKTEVVSLDDFYLPTDRLPVLEDGTRDIESVNALDTALINKCFGEIIKSGKTVLPSYNFLKKERVTDAREIDISNRGIIIAEGLHALNPIITSKVPSKHIFKAYVSVNRRIEASDGNTLLTSRQIRLIRRTLRDRIFRSSSLNDTLSLWGGVVEGEKKYLYCFKPTADVQIKTLHIYEPCLYKNEFLSLCDEADRDSEWYEYFKRTADVLRAFNSIDSSLIPPDSLIREFIGNGKYN